MLHETPASVSRIARLSRADFAEEGTKGKTYAILGKNAARCAPWPISGQARDAIDALRGEEDDARLISPQTKLVAGDDMAGLFSLTLHNIHYRALRGSDSYGPIVDRLMEHSDELGRRPDVVSDGSEPLLKSGCYDRGGGETLHWDANGDAPTLQGPCRHILLARANPSTWSSRSRSCCDGCVRCLTTMRW